MRHGLNRKIFIGKHHGLKKSLICNLIKSFFIHERIKVLHKSAQVMRPIVEKLISLGRKQNLSSFRLLIARTRDVAIARKIYNKISPQYAERPGGYTRIIKYSYRKGDNAKMSIISLVKDQPNNVQT